MTLVLRDVQPGYYNITIQSTKAVTVLVHGETTVGKLIHILSETNDITLVYMSTDDALLVTLRAMGIAVEV